MNALEFDYVIVGAGSAGCVLADRLTQCGKFSVLLLESGGSDARFWVKVPLGYAINVSNPAVNWGYQTAPDPGLNARSTLWPRGRLIGGSSSINAMAYVRGLAQRVGIGRRSVRSMTEWKPAAISASMAASPKAMVRCGCLTCLTKWPRFHIPFCRLPKIWGMRSIPDMNAPDTSGVSYYRSTVRKGIRWSSADAFLRPAQKRPNLTVITKANVNRLISAGPTVKGVTFNRGHQVQVATANREVILCAGAINSPKILQLSGFGPAKTLRRHGIAVRRDLPQVGQGLQDHLDQMSVLRRRLLPWFSRRT